MSDGRARSLRSCGLRIRRRLLNSTIAVEVVVVVMLDVGGHGREMKVGGAMMKIVHRR